METVALTFLERELTKDLCHAAQTNDLAGVRTVLDAGADLNRSDGDGWTPLRYAARFGNIDALRLLLEFGADINQGDRAEYDATYLHHAAASGNVECVRTLIEAGCPVHERDRFGRTPIFAAMERHSPPVAVAMVSVLLEAGADPVTSDNYGTTPLHLAAQNGYTALVRILLDAGTNPNVTDVAHATPLQYAVQKARFIAAEDASQIVTQLLTAGADPNLAMHASYLGDAGTVLHFAAEAPTEIVRQLLAFGANPNAVNKRNQTPLMLMLGNAENFGAVLAAGADVTPLLAGNGKPAILTAVENGNIIAVTAFLAAGSDPNQPYRRKLPLHVAITKAKTEAVKALLKAGADPLLADNHGVTPLQRAQRRRHKAIIDLVERAILARIPTGNA